jgi:Ras-related GTP-binding protein A/B
MCFVQAWSSIVYSLIPNVKHLETHLENFCKICDAEEVVLFERTTFLVISHSTQVQSGLEMQLNPKQQAGAGGGNGSFAPDPHRFEKISNIIKQFKLSCSKSQAQFQSMEVRNRGFTAFVDVLTPNTYIMVIMSDPSIRKCL